MHQVRALARDDAQLWEQTALTLRQPAATACICLLCLRDGCWCSCRCRRRFCVAGVAIATAIDSAAVAIVVVMVMAMATGCNELLELPPRQQLLVQEPWCDLLLLPW